MRFLRFLSLLAVAAGLSACASIAPSPTPTTTGVLDAFHLLGRVSVRYGGEGFSGSIDWRHAPARDEVLILSPLGQGIAQLVRDAGGVTLTTSDQQVFHATDAESLTHEVLGWRFPLSGLVYWVQGYPVPGLVTEVRRGADGGVETLIQDGWRLDYGGRKEFAAGVLPGRVFMENSELRLKLAVDEWQP